MDKLVNILHISDIHLNAEDSFDQRLVLNAFLEDLTKLRELNINPDIIIVSGDLAKIADHSEAYSEFLSFIIKICDIVGLDEEKLILCPGNHDVSRKIVGPALPLIRSWRDDCEDRDKANLLQMNAAYKAHVYRTFESYYQLADSFSQKSIVSSGTSYTTYFFRELGLSVISINTATLSTAGLVSPRDDERKLVVPERLLVEAIASVPKESHKIVVGHHPTNWLSEQNEELVRRLLGEASSMYLCGHIHMARPETVSGLLGTCHHAQTGALYEWRDRWAGYAVYQVVPGSNNVKAHYRRWYEDRRGFSKAEELADDGVTYSPPEARDFFTGLRLRATPQELGPVDKVDSQISRSVIQDCFLGGSFGSRRPDRYGMADHRGVVAHRTRQEVPTVAR